MQSIAEIESWDSKFSEEESNPNNPPQEEIDPYNNTVESLQDYEFEKKTYNDAKEKKIESLKKMGSFDSNTDQSIGSLESCSSDSEEECGISR